MLIIHDFLTQQDLERVRGIITAGRPSFGAPVRLTKNNQEELQKIIGDKKESIENYCMLAYKRFRRSNPVRHPIDFFTDMFYFHSWFCSNS
jgi:hypothetical protein